MMRNKILAALPLVGALMLTQQAQADTTINFSFSGGGVSASGALTYDPSSSDGISGGNPITSISGVFSDSTLGLSDVAITGLVPPTNPNTAPARLAGTSPYPVAMRYFFVAGGIFAPGQPVAPFLSYDNLYYPNGAPVVCVGYPGAGQVLDPYGILFSINADGSTVGVPGDVVDLFGNGIGFGGFGLGLADANQQYDYVGGGITLSVPEPSTWAMMVLGFAGLGFAGYRKQRKDVPVAA